MLKKHYDSIDLMKFIACFFVVAIHSDPFYDINQNLNNFISQGVSRLAVPLFFLATAFFFFNNLSDIKITNYCKRLLILYGCWFAITLPITIYNRFIMSEYTMGVTIFKFVKSIFLTSTFSGSWYLTSCLFCGILFYFLEKLPDKVRKIVTIVLSIVIYIFCVSTSAYGLLFDKLGFANIYQNIEFYFTKPYTSILVGIPYFALGRYFLHNEDRKLKKLDYVLGISASILLSIEIILTNICGFNRSKDCFLMLIPVAAFIFKLVINSDIQLKKAATMRVVSTVVFFSQFIWLFFIEIAEYALQITIPCVFKFIIAVVLSLITSVIIEKLQKIKMFNWLKYFY